MMITKVLSYKNAWNEFSINNSEELNEIISALPRFLSEYHEVRNQNKVVRSRELWEQKLFEHNWEILERTESAICRNFLFRPKNKRPKVITTLR